MSTVPFRKASHDALHLTSRHLILVALCAGAGLEKLFVRCTTRYCGPIIATSLSPDHITIVSDYCHRHVTVDNFSLDNVIAEHSLLQVKLSLTKFMNPSCHSAMISLYL